VFTFALFGMQFCLETFVETDLFGIVISFVLFFFQTDRQTVRLFETFSVRQPDRQLRFLQTAPSSCCDLAGIAWSLAGA
jgi:hypothetical protein